MACRTSVEADCDRCFCAIDNDAGGESLVTEWDRERSLGVVMCEREGDLRESGKSVRSAGVFFGFCGGGIICAGCRSGAGDFVIFFSLG